MKQYSDAQLEKAMLKPICQSVENGSRTSSCERKEIGQPRDVLQQAVMGRADEEARPVEQRWGRDGDGAHVGACSVRGGQRGTGIWQENLEQYLARFTEARTSATKAGKKTELEVHASAKMCLREHHHLQRCMWSCIILRLEVMDGVLMCGQYL